MFNNYKLVNLNVTKLGEMTTAYKILLGKRPLRTPA
jgi:hypothetical protein